MKTVQESNNNFIKPTFLKKLLALFAQILMLPLSCIIQIFGGCTIIYCCGIIIGLIYMPHEVLTGVPALFFSLLIALAYDYGFGFLSSLPYARKMYKVKKISFEGGTWYEGTGVVERDIKDKYGNKIGSYETTGTTYDYEESEDQKTARIRGAIALPLRIISIIAAIIGLFTDKFYVKIKELPGINYNKTLHLWLDIIVPQSPKND